MSTKVTDLTPLVTTDDADVLHIVDVGDDEQEAQQGQVKRLQ